MDFFQSSDIEPVSLKNWIDWAGGNKSDVFVALPMIQRGSVWKPKQIIDLWDSLLQGMPIGSLMTSQLQKGMPVRRIGQSKRESVPEGGGLGLIDGQQRTLAMLAAWPLTNSIEVDRRVWIDFADKPLSGQILRLRVTTLNQPFGFQTDELSSKLSLESRRNAIVRFEKFYRQRNQIAPNPNIGNTLPFSHGLSLPIDLRWLIEIWRADPVAWRETVLIKLDELKTETEVMLATSEVKSVRREWPTHETVLERIEILQCALLRLFNKMELPLIRVDDRFFAIKNDQDDPPLALLFKRVGTGGTKLSDADYVYSIIKHLRPETYDLVESLYEKKNEQVNIASLLSATDLVMSAVRLAAVGWRSEPDYESPSKQNFHALLSSGDFLNDRFMRLIESQENTKSPIVHYFAQVQICLEYRKNEPDDIGLPCHMFPHIGRPLVQVLLRIAQAGYLADGSNIERRNDILRLVLFWLVCVIDQKKASKIAYEVLKNADETFFNENRLGQRVHDELIKQKKVAMTLFTPSAIKERSGLAHSQSMTTVFRGESRFTPIKNDDKDHALCGIYRRWWQPWTHQHPMLLWLQRNLVATIPGDPMSGREEDTPYDYDHILPSSHWSGWTGKGGNIDTLLKFVDENDPQYWLVGNGIGNVRVWDSSKNRSDGDIAPAYKLCLAENPDFTLEPDQENLEHMSTAGELLNHSAIPDSDEHKEPWIACSRDKANKQTWDQDRALAFQLAVELRTFYLYDRYFKELQFDKWYEDNDEPECPKH